ncbi:MAG: methyltransferase domain-containing protein [Erythrobacter sp.]|nr:MAG: methyltransferase domain-containing protein [Erythrobacter sp.]
MAGVLAEHHDYLALKNRHALYARAIAQVVRSGDVVADLGCGFGILGIQCLQAGAAHVIGIDRTDAIEIARETVSREGLGDHYTCIRASSFRAELPALVDVIICDHVGFFGVDYGIVEMLEDAHRRMLKPGGKVMPRRIVLQVAGVSSARCGDLARMWSQPPVPREYHWLDSYAANARHAVDLGAGDVCSPPVTLGSVPLGEDNPATLQFSARIEVSHDGQLHGLAGWFDCELAEGVWMTNSPLAENSIRRSQAFFPLTTTLAVEKGELIDVAFSIRHDHPIITWTLTVPRTGERQVMSTWKSTILTQADLAVQTGRNLRPNALARARKALLALLDGTRNAAEIEAHLLTVEPPLFPTSAELRRFVKAELGSVSE